MATELAVQSERAFQKQPHIFQNGKKTSSKQKRIGKGGRRWHKDVGLGFRTPKTAIEGSYIGMWKTEIRRCGIASNAMIAHVLEES
jgi:small subunit ribosomal protein S11e